jgi:urate oxidase
VSKYAHIFKAFVTVEQLRWSRVQVAGEGSSAEHSHAFYRDGDDKRIVKVEVCIFVVYVMNFKLTL